jgi:hypothetical protein
MQHSKKVQHHLKKAHEHMGKAREMNEKHEKELIGKLEKMHKKPHGMKHKK